MRNVSLSGPTPVGEPEQSRPSPFEDIGRRFVAFGEALMNPDTDLCELVSRAHDCGLEFEFRLSSRDTGDEETRPA